MKTLASQTTQRGTAAIAAACILLCGSLSCTVWKDIPMKFGRVSEPVTQIVASPDTATVVLANQDGLYIEALRRVPTTFMLADGSVVGEVTSNSFAVAHLPPGRHTLVEGDPSWDSDDCKGLVLDVAPGKVYVVFGKLGRALYPVAPSRETALVLSRLTHVDSDLNMGRARVQKDRDFWDDCVASASKELTVIPPGDWAKLAVDEVTLGSPP